ncbi:T9SS type A sorting domain-containing protein [Flavobacterium sp.]|uniref:T9SS type A sorting domain-containing protein n=1 Tax=Flavobacterium sp. TaxID=239 RepID=UPI002FDD3265
MKLILVKALPLLVLMISCPFGWAQLHVKSGSYVFVKDTYVYVNQDTDLQNNAAVYLRNEGQFLQGTAGISTNKGFGFLSVFQEGTSDNYDYNYWCSPVGNASAISGNENFGITLLHVPTTATNSSPATIDSATYDGQSANGSLSIASYWIFKYLSGVDYSDWFQSGANTDIAAGQGFTMKGTAGVDATNVGEFAVNNPGGAQRYDFRGKPNDGTIAVTVSANNLTLTGNPYPSALHVNAFLLDPSNIDCTGIAYYWEHDKSVNSHLLLAYRGGYGTYAPISTSPTEYGIYVPATFDSYNIDGTVNTAGASSGLSIQRKYAPIGQGFMIKGTASGSPTSVALKNSHRVYYKESGPYSQFERLSVPNSGFAEPVGPNYVSHIRLNTMMNHQFTRQIALVFLPTATDGIDRGIDAQSPAEETLPNDVYFFLEQDRYVIQGVAFDVNKRIPIGIKATNNAVFTFDASMVYNFDESQPIYLYDALYGSYHDIKNSTYELTLPAGVYHNRFEITFTTTALNAPVNAVKELVVFQDNANQQLHVSNPQELFLQAVTLFDINGKLIFKKENVGANNRYQFATSGLSDAVYLVELTADNNVKKTQKIIIAKQ